MSAALAQLPATLDELLHRLGDACVVCGENTEPEREGLLHVAVCGSCGSVLEEPQAPPRRILRLVP